MTTDKNIRIQRVMKLTGIAKSTVWKWIKTKNFPKPRKLSPKVSVWKESEVLEWIEDNITEAGA